MRRMSRLRPKDARAYLRRWQLVEEMEAAELRATPIEIKLRQLAALMGSRGLFPDGDVQGRLPDDELRRTWDTIRRAQAQRD